MRKFIIRLIGPFVQWFAKFYFSKARNYSFGDIKGTVLPGVFYPNFTLSTKILLEFIQGMNLQGKKFLELGCGTGFISCLAAKKGALVLASDINPKAIENTSMNANLNNLSVETVLSDLFVSIHKQSFDLIIINPPYYPKQPKNLEEQAWYCGENFEYFDKLFSSIQSYIHTNSDVYMILSEDCQIDHIQSIANNFEYELVEELSKKVWGEKNYLFSLKSI